jgi:acetyltransferase-like isoleucine patch superfamily enzyme
MGLVTKLKSALRAFLKEEAQTADRLIKNGWLSITESTRVDGAVFDIRSKTQKEYLSIGRGSMVCAHFVIENEGGRIQVGDNSFLGGGMYVSITGIEIGSNVMISWGCTFIDNDAHSLNWLDRTKDVINWKRGVDEKEIGAYKDWSKVESAKIIVHDNAWVGFNCIVLKGVVIGKGAVVAAGSVVTKDVEAFTLVAGNPARYIKHLP